MKHFETFLFLRKCPRGFRTLVLQATLLNHPDDGSTKVSPGFPHFKYVVLEYNGINYPRRRGVLDLEGEYNIGVEIALTGSDIVLSFGWEELSQRIGKQSISAVV